MILVADERERLDRFLARVLPRHSRSKISRLASEGAVLVDGVPQKPAFALKPGMRVELDEPSETSAHDLTPANIPLEVVYEDEDLLIINKPRGLATHPAATLKEPSLVNALLARPHSLSGSGGAFRPGIVHRLDKATTGLIVVAKNDQAHVHLAKQIASKAAERRYVAVVAGEVSEERFVIKAPIARDVHNRLKMAVSAIGKDAATHVKRLGSCDAGTVVAVRLETGRTHQIRVHLRAIGCPVIGDSIYAPRELSSGPLQLHACYLALRQPQTDALIAVYASPPIDLLGANRVSR